MLDDLIHKANLAKIEAADEEQRKINADELISYYRGNHRALLEDYLGELLSESDLLEKYKALAAVRNVVRSTIHKVALLGSEPITVTWGEGSGSDQEAWDAWADEINLPLFLQTVLRYAELLKTVVVLPYWDETAEDEEGSVVGAVRLRLVTPNLIDVYSAPENRDPGRPDVFVFQVYTGEGESYSEVWDLVNRETWRETEDGEMLGPSEPIPPEWGYPMVTFRRGYPLDSYWTEEGQEELLSIQRRVNYLLTQTNVQIFYGGMRIPVIEGAPHEDEAPIVFDPSVVVFTGQDAAGQPRTLSWLGPEVASVVETIKGEIADDLDAVSEAFDLPPGMIRATTSEARSGLSIELENAPLRDKARKDRLIYTPTLRALVAQIARVWNAHGSTKLGEEFSVDIPDTRYAGAEAAQTERDLLLIDKGLKKPSEFIRDRFPDFDDEAAATYLSEVAEEKRQLKSGSSFSVPGALGSLFNSDTTTTPEV